MPIVTARRSHGNLWPQGKLRLDLDHPLARDLVGCWPLTFAHPYEDLCGSNPLTSLVQSDTAAGGIRADAAFVSAGRPQAGINILRSASGNLTAGSACSFAVWACALSGGFSTDSSFGGKWNSNGWMLYNNTGQHLRGYLNNTNFEATATLPGAGVPVFLAYTWDGATVRVYQNAIEVKNGSASTHTAPAADFQLGNYANGNGNPLNGTLSHAKFWRRCLSPGEIWSLFDPRTRLDLYAVPMGQVYVSITVATAKPWLHYARQMSA